VEINYTITKVHSSYRAKAQRYAVLAPLRAKGESGKTRVADIKADLATLRTHWHARLKSLQSAGWTRSESFKWGYAFNCPPFGVDSQTSVALETRVIPCGLHLVCPFCWARLVVGPAYDRLTFAFYRGEATPQFRMDVIDLARSIKVDGDLQEAFAYIRSYRSIALGLFPGNYGAYVLHTVEPQRQPPSKKRGKKPKPPTWIIRERVLALVDTDFPMPTVKPTTTIHRTSSPKKALLAAIVGRVCGYPTRMLRGPADRVVRVLSDRESVKLSAYYGGLRNLAAQTRKGPPKGPPATTP